MQHWLLDAGGAKLDIAHHGPGQGIRAWTRGNVFELYLRSMLFDALALGNEIPAGVLRGHMHSLTYRRSIHQVGNRIWELPGWITAPYCFIGAHAQQAARSPGGMAVGMLALEIQNGKIFDWHPFAHSVDLRIRESV